MPEISRFFGIVIRMYFRDHAPPHFHARYGEHNAAIQISPPGLIDGDIPPRALSMIIEWTALHQAELLENWRLAQSDATPRRIEPLR